MVAPTNTANNLVIDAQQLSKLKNEAKQNSPEALKETAKQFEALFLNMMLKSMRDATPQDGIFDSEQTKTYTSMLDQQLSQHLANRGTGLADMLVKQLSRTITPAPTAGEQTDKAAFSQQNGRINAQLFQQTYPYQPAQQLKQALSIGDVVHTEAAEETSQLADWISQKPEMESPNWDAINVPNYVKNFGQRMLNAAQSASESSGIPAAYLLGQAALESGWGRSEIKNQDGTTSHNVFGIKATGNWNGKVTLAATTEYVNGIKQQKVERFRAYDSYEESFKDFANLISQNPRYETALNNVDNASAYSRALQKGGYATDPNYAKKLTQVIAMTEKLAPN